MVVVRHRNDVTYAKTIQAEPMKLLSISRHKVLVYIVGIQLTTGTHKASWYLTHYGHHESALAGGLNAHNVKQSWAHLVNNDIRVI
jgi:phosphoribosylanthranilate isomerase